MPAVKNKGIAGDEFCAMVYASCLQSGANTLTFTKLETGYGTLDKSAWNIRRIEYYLSATDLDKLLTSADGISMALTTSALVSALSLSSAAVLDLFQLQLYYSAAAMQLIEMPFIRDFTNLPGGGKLCLPNPLYLAVNSTSLATAVTAYMRISFTVQPLEDNQWVELVEQTRLLT